MTHMDECRGIEVETWDLCDEGPVYWMERILEWALENGVETLCFYPEMMLVLGRVRRARR